MKVIATEVPYGMRMQFESQIARLSRECEGLMGDRQFLSVNGRRHTTRVWQILVDTEGFEEVLSWE